MSIIVQQVATIYNLFISVNCSTYFGWYLHPSSGAHITLCTASGISVTVTVIRAPDDGWRYHPKHVEQFTDINKLYIVATCWTIIDINGGMASLIPNLGSSGVPRGVGGFNPPPPKF
jgi:hypothetical protein